MPGTGSTLTPTVAAMSWRPVGVLALAARRAGVRAVTTTTAAADADGGDGGDDGAAPPTTRADATTGDRAGRADHRRRAADAGVVPDGLRHQWPAEVTAADGTVVRRVPVGGRDAGASGPGG